MKAQPLSKRALDTYRPLFASYLDIQKNKDIFALPDAEVRGRWKSFVHKWNRAALAEGWYDPATKQRADAAWAEDEAFAAAESHASAAPAPRTHDTGQDSESDASDYGPAQAPVHTSATVPAGKGIGPALPTFADLAERDDTAAADAAQTRLAERKAARTEQRERLDELAPRAEPGTKERALEKKREAAASAAAFREGAGGGDAEVGDAEMMGSGGPGEARELRARMERAKSERQVRREEALMARKAEREERTAELREKETRTMEYLRAIAQEHWGKKG